MRPSTWPRTERHRRREEQADRPENEQREAAGAARDEPAVAQLLPLVDAAAPVQQRSRRDAIPLPAR
jgi:hypothetical protein